MTWQDKLATNLDTLLENIEAPATRRIKSDRKMYLKNGSAVPGMGFQISKESLAAQQMEIAYVALQYAKAKGLEGLDNALFAQSRLYKDALRKAVIQAPEEFLQSLDRKIAAQLGRTR
jgi:hypothetical protein